MGYQESYVRIESDEYTFDDLVNLTRSLGKEFFEQKYISPVRIITLKKSIKGDLDQMCHPEIEYYFPKGERFLYVVGERGCQRSIEKMFGEHALEGTEIYFTECFPSHKIFDKVNPIAEHEMFNW